ncbi:PhzF family phenazine biosynthesis protein [Bacillus salitolerans]|uniref:PhzF family phenazine biosynthesis protein n=1 Tax=Bacillus salitolerans TaxID=1437434 RepID=A0ABW4LKB0_9BACI
MKELQYVLLDVFTDKPFGGNQLAVFLHCDDLSGDKMQTIAKELNLSETVFLFPPNPQNSDFTLRIFTPRMELPFAGHPTIGTAYLLGIMGLVPVKNGVTTITLQEKIGAIPVELYSVDGQIQKVNMAQPIPKIVEEGHNKKRVAELLSLSEEDIDQHLPIQSLSAGIPYLYIPVKSLDAMKRIRFRTDIWNESFAGSENNKHIFTFCLETELKSTNVHSRMFAPAMGIVEDPATGSASGPLGYYLANHRIGEPIDETYYYVSEQGIEIGRPSLIEIMISKKGHETRDIKIGGTAVIIGEGVLRV